MVRRVGFGSNEAPEQRKKKSRPARKVEKYHLDGAHAAKPEPDREPVVKAPQQRPNPSKKPISRKKFWIYVVIGIWLLPVVVGFVTMVIQKLLGGTGLAPSPFIVVAFSAVVVYKLFQLAKKMMPPS